jgi:hypothetical protein
MRGPPFRNQNCTLRPESRSPFYKVLTTFLGRRQTFGLGHILGCNVPFESPYTMELNRWNQRIGTNETRGTPQRNVGGGITTL